MFQNLLFLSNSTGYFEAKYEYKYYKFSQRNPVHNFLSNKTFCGILTDIFKE